MKIQVTNLGAIRQAEFELGDMTIICGKNNTGKTYATYALFGFLSFWHDAFSIKMPEKLIKRLMVDGSIRLSIDEIISKANDVLAEACREYSGQLSVVFASAEKNFETTTFLITIDPEEIKPEDSYEKTMGAPKQQILNINKQVDNSSITVSLLVDKDKVSVYQTALSRTVGEAVKNIVFSSLFPKPFIASAERTGAAIFRKELNFARNRLLEQMSSMKKELNPFELLNQVYSDYALPVRSNVDFTRQLENVAKKSSFISKEYPEILDDFRDIIGGEYRVIRDELYYVPNDHRRIKLTMDESSSAVRSLLDLGFYLRHVVQPGDLLMVDEPELNLHPENQRRIAQLFTRLVNLGIKVFITTHSDYIIKELNTIIMLKQDEPHIVQLCLKEGYKQEELISVDRIRVYIAEEALVKLDGYTKKIKCNTLVPAEIDPKLGIEARTFDETIDDMNRIQDEILFGGEEQ